jgi:hypothetical protein
MLPRSIRTECGFASGALRLISDHKEMFMNKPLAATVIGFSMTLMASAHAETYGSAAIRADQQLVQSTTQAAVDTAGTRATAAQDARNVAISRQTPSPTLAERRADVLAGAVYPQSGAATAALAANNATVSRQMPVPNMVERRADVLASAVYPQSGPAMAALAAKNADAQEPMVN